MDEFECEMKSFGRLEKLDQRISEFFERNDKVISVNYNPTELAQDKVIF
jgi:hypothetical protein